MFAPLKGHQFPSQNSDEKSIKTCPQRSESMKYLTSVKYPQKIPFLLTHTVQSALPTSSKDLSSALHVIERFFLLLQASLTQGEPKGIGIQEREGRS